MIFTFKQLDFDNKPLEVSLLPPTETMQSEVPKSVRCRCWNIVDRGNKMKEDCVFLEAEDIGGTKKYPYYAYYCRKFNLYNEDIYCENCKERLRKGLG